MPRLRKGQQCRREQWRSDVLKAKKLPSSTRMFLVSVLAPHMKTDGFVSYSRALLADEMGVDERTITRHFTRARDSGWLMSLRVGHKGLTAEYMASWPTAQSGTHVVPLWKSQRGTETNPLTRDKIVPLKGWKPRAKGDTWCPATSSYFVTTAVDVPHDTRTCACDECTEWMFVLLGRVCAGGARQNVVLGIGSSNPKSESEDHKQKRSKEVVA